MTSKPWQAHILSAFPQMFPGALGYSNVGKALASEIWSLKVHDLRQYASSRYASIDDTPCGGGAGMVICPDIIAGAMEHVLSDPDCIVLPRVYLSPRGAPLDMPRAKALAAEPGLIVLCGRYEGVDQRALDYFNFEEISLGDYVISGGELASFVLLDAAVRLLPNVLGAADSLKEESFEDHLLEYPHYTRPALWREMSVPEVLLSGHHRRIVEWRYEQSCNLTATRRPDLWARHRAEHTKEQGKG